MLTVIGDVHGYYDRYKKFISGREYTVQIGDMGHRYELLADVDPTHHKFFGGNHDNYQLIYDVPNNLGDYGVSMLGGIEFYWMRGAFSIDVCYRTPMINWWPNEELSKTELNDCVRLYEQIRPNVVLSHDCPKSISDMIGSRQILKAYGFDPDTFTTRTGEALQIMLDIHKPSLWLFGHHHVSKILTYKGCEFRCLAEMDGFEIRG